MAEKLVGAALYDGWLTPAASLDLLRNQGWDFDTAAKAIGRRVQSDLIHSMAMIAVSGSGKIRQEYFHLNAITWKYWAPLATYDFWTTGDIEIRSPGVTGYGDLAVC